MVWRVMNLREGAIWYPWLGGEEAAEVKATFQTKGVLPKGK